MSSFSRLADDGPLAPSEEEGRDRDAEPEELRFVNAPSARLPFGGLPRGRVTGDVLHAVLEEADFTTATHASLAEIAATKLARHGMAIDPFRDVVAAGVLGVIDTVLAPGDVRLRRVATRDRASELPFVLPVAGEKGAKALTARALSEVFLEHGEGTVKAYGDRARRLGFPPLTGFLQGFVDLVFGLDGRYWVVDWKSSWLGASPDDYAPERIASSMDEPHYVLQYHLYALAVHRHLSARVPRYDYDRDFGGALYVYLRGTQPEWGHERGVYRDKPSRALIDALSRVLVGESA
jgi:exodeoxyribonuclease V beta subunit